MKKLHLTLLILFPICLSAQTRDPYLWPFSSTSIWNMPIHINAIYAPANLTGTPTDPLDSLNTLWAPMPAMDYEHIILAPTAPLCQVKHCSVGWTSGDRCIPTDSIIIDTVPVPAGYIVPDNNTNGCATFIAPDGVTVMQNQPFTRCVAGSYATTLLKFPEVGIYSNGESGNHGGSGLSGFGGSIRVGELRPGQQGPRHALKIIIYAKQYLYPGISIADNYRWPATKADSYSVGYYGSATVATNTTNTEMKMGSLLAIPANVDINTLGMETVPGMQLAWTLQKYGAYIVDDTWGPAFGFCGEKSNSGDLDTQFLADYGFNLIDRVIYNTPWMRDNQRLCVALRVVSNNSALTIGGGPTNDTINRLAPMACPFDFPGSGNMCSPVSGIIKNETNLIVQIFPNPSNGEFNIMLPTDNATIVVTDVLGQQIRKIQTTQNKTNLQLDYNGIYFVYVTTKQGTTTRKLIISR